MTQSIHSPHHRDIPCFFKPFSPEGMLVLHPCPHPEEGTLVLGVGVSATAGRSGLRATEELPFPRHEWCRPPEDFHLGMPQYSQGLRWDQLSSFPAPRGKQECGRDGYSDCEEPTEVGLGGAACGAALSSCPVISGHLPGCDIPQERE